MNRCLHRIGFSSGLISAGVSHGIFGHITVLSLSISPPLSLFSLASLFSRWSHEGTSLHVNINYTRHAKQQHPNHTNLPDLVRSAGRGYFCKAEERAGAFYVTVEVRIPESKRGRSARP